ncbi:hypothetical protein BS47DRAFT_1278003, partial [Hydnum rufescens UP504]
ASGSGPALQLVEYSNGQLVWSVVDGLRASAEDDWDIDELDDSVSYSERDPRRGSGMSEMSLRGGTPSRGNASDDVQLLFKEHRRMASKDSDSSYVSRRKVLPPSRLVRPETKVYYSSTAEIESLIETISRGLDAGSFNVLP